MNRFAFVVLIAVGLGGVTFNYAVARSTDPKLGLSKSTRIYLVDPKTHELVKDKNEKVLISYVPAGTWVKMLEKKPWKTRTLVQTENGIFGYIPEDNLWGANDLNGFAQLGTVAIVRRNFPYQKKGIVHLWFTRSESYQVLRENDVTGEITMQVDVTKKIVEEKDPPPHVVLIKTIENQPAYFEADVKKEYAKVIDFEKESPVKFRLFDRHVADGIKGLQKPCGRQKSTAIKTKVGGGFELNKFLIIFGVGASRETENIETFDESVNVERTYYIEKGEDAKYRLDRRKDCKTKVDSFSLLKIDEGAEVIVTKDWAERVGLRVEASEGRVRLTCPRDYFKFDEALSKELDPSERAFLITKVARFEMPFTKCEEKP